MKTKTFDPNQLVITAGPAIIDGLAADTMLSIEMEADSYITEVDSRGVSSRFKQNNNNALVTLMITQTSPSNNVFALYYNADLLSNIGAFPMTIKDSLGDTLFSSLECYVKKLPTVSFGSTGQNREWVIQATDAILFPGGSH